VLLGVVTACSDTVCVAIGKPSMTVAVLAADTGNYACNSFVFAEDPDRASVLASCPAPDCCDGKYKVGDDCCHGGYSIGAAVGTHTITAKAPGYKTQSQSVRVVDNGGCDQPDPFMVTFVLEPE
jgi:hypothetical protein